MCGVALTQVSLQLQHRGPRRSTTCFAQHRSFDGYKGHLAIDPDSEIITDTEVTPGNTGDAEPAPNLISDLIDPPTADPGTAPGGDPAVYGDAAYGAGEVLHPLHDAGIDIKTKVQAPNALGGTFTKDKFTIDLTTGTVTCPNRVTITIRPITGHARHAGQADFGTACTDCPLRPQCATSKTGRHVSISRWETTWPPPAPDRPTPHGRPTTGPPAPKSNARSPT